jgi:hypothetical protein
MMILDSFSGENDARGAPGRTDFGRPRERRSREGACLSSMKGRRDFRTPPREFA